MLTSTLTEKLYQEIASLDRIVFDAYNSCNRSVFKEYFVEDLEFFHDKSGLILGRKNMLEALETTLWSSKNMRMRRELIPESLEVYPLLNFGAIQIGKHYYYQSIDGLPEILVEVAKFTHVWQQKDNKWRICRVMSYDHQPYEKKTNNLPHTR